MAVHATSSLRNHYAVIHIRKCRRGSLPGQQGLLTSMRRMTALAQERCTHLQQAFCRCSMWIVTVGAVIIDRFVTMHKGTAFFHMAGVAGFIDAIALHEFRSNRTMRIMAIGAGHLAFGNRVMRRTADLRALFLVAGKTHIGLSTLVAHIIMSVVVNGVARDTGNVFFLVGASFPVRTLGILLMTGKTSLILQGCLFRLKVAGCTALGSENDIR